MKLFTTHMEKQNINTYFEAIEEEIEILTMLREAR